MKKLLISLAAAGCVFPLGSTNVFAGDDDGMQVIPVEHFICKYNQGQGPADLDKATNAWNKYMDDSGGTTYAAWTLTPVYYGDEQDFDFIWMGAWTDGNAMGADTDLWYKTGGKISAMFDKVASCSGHYNSASIRYKAPPDTGPQSAGVLTYSSCNLKEGVPYSAVALATAEWADVIGDAGSEVGIFHQFPVFGGGGDEAPDFFWMEAYANHAALGADYERMGNGELYKASEELFGHLVECDTSRVYNAMNRRFVKLRD